MAHVAWIIPLLPLAAFVVVIGWGPRLPLRGAAVSIAGIVLAGVAAIAVLIEVASGARGDLTYTWVSLGARPLTVGFVVDPLSAVMLVMVGVVASLITIYSVGYMHGDPRFSRFFAYLSLFQFSMLFLILADNFLFIYAGWELVGLCSYLLIGFWFERPSAARAAVKAFITTRIGDFSMMIGILILFVATGSLSFSQVFRGVQAGQIGGPLLTAAAVLVFGGAVGKSAQIPLHVWLPDAMEGPTPVSALIHAATMVAAGVYLVARTYPLFFLSAGQQALLVVAYVGAATAFVAATLGVVEDDIKRVLAYSTMSQLGYMMMGLGVLGYTAGMFHLITHAFFKALLFLGAGSIIHAVATNNMKEMGGLSRPMPVTFWTFLVATLALTGIPPLSGFFSKDAILAAAYAHNRPLWVVGTVTAFITALYMGRLVWYTFAGTFRGGTPAEGVPAAHGGSHDAGEVREPVHPHESPAIMTIPLVILAAGTVLLGIAEGPFERLVHFTGVEAPALKVRLLVVSVAAALAGWLLAGVIYPWRLLPSAALRRALHPLYVLLTRKYYVDDLYAWMFLRVGGAVTWLAGAFDRYVVDGLVNLTGWLTGRSGSFLRYLQTGREENYLLVIFLGVLVMVVVRLLR